MLGYVVKCGQARLAALLVLLAAWSVGGKVAVIGILVGVAMMQVAHRVHYGHWFDP